MKYVGVTGGAGFIGNYVVEELQRKGYTPVIFDRHDKHTSNAQFFLGDVTDPVAMTELAAHADGIIHLAAVLGTQETIKNPTPAAKSNLLGGLNFLEAVTQYDLPAVYIAVGNYFMNNPYSITKNMIERFSHMYNADRGSRVNIVRAVNAYGPRQLSAEPFAHGKVRKITPALVCRALCGIPMELYGGGTQVSDMVYVGDVAKALVLALEKADQSTVFNHAIEVGSPEEQTILFVAKKVNQIIQEYGYEPVEIKTLPMRPGEQQGVKVRANIQTLKDIDFDTKELVSLEDGLRKTIEYFIDTKGKDWHAPS